MPKEISGLSQQTLDKKCECLLFGKQFKTFSNYVSQVQNRSKTIKVSISGVVPCVVFLCCRASRLKCIKRIVFLPKREPQTFGSSQRRERFPPISYDQPSKLELGKGYLAFCGFTIEAPKYLLLRQTLGGFLPVMPRFVLF